MATIRPFRSIRPAEELAASIAALPYDVYSRAEAKAYVSGHPLSFLKIDRAETQFPDDTDLYSQAVYDRARDTLREMISDGSFVQDEAACFYLYALTMDGRTQTGIVGCASVDDYLDNTIRKHENTREDKELDRIRHVDTMSAQTGPIFLAYRQNETLRHLIQTVKTAPALYDFVSEDGVRHQVWKIDTPELIGAISDAFTDIGHIYIADGHHRAASAVKVGLKRRAEHPDYDGTEEFNYFLSVLFPAEELKIYDYNRVASGLNGYTREELLEKLAESFTVEIYSEAEFPAAPYHPAKKGEIGLYCGGAWYRLTALPHLYTGDPVGDLDVSLLQDTVLDPLLGIKDVKTDPRIQFVGGIRGLEELMRIADAAPADTEAGNAATTPEQIADSSDTAERIAFAMYPTSMEEMLAVADAGRLMPPKSTWFEPKLRSGLFIHAFEPKLRSGLFIHEIESAH